MKFHPQHIIFWAVSRYLTEAQINELKTDLGCKLEENVFLNSKIINLNRKFLSKIKDHFDIERLLKSPVIWQDAWVYNYIQYDTKKAFPKNKLIAKYEREIFIPAYLSSLKATPKEKPSSLKDNNKEIEIKPYDLNQAANCDYLEIIVGKNKLIEIDTKIENINSYKGNAKYRSFQDYKGHKEDYIKTFQFNNINDEDFSFIKDEPKYRLGFLDSSKLVENFEIFYKEILSKDESKKNNIEEKQEAFLEWNQSQLKLNTEPKIKRKMKILKNFRSLPKGIKRLLISGTLVVPFLLSPIILFFLGSLTHRKYDYEGNLITVWASGFDFFMAGLVLGIPLYWLIVLLIAWVYDGFKSGSD